MEKPVALDHFGEYAFVHGLKSRGARAVFGTKKADFENNRYNTTLWLMEEGGVPRHLAGPGAIGGWWWQDDATLLLARPGSEEDKKLEEKGLPTTLLQALPMNGPGEGYTLARLHHPVEDVLPLAGGRLLLVLHWNGAVEQALRLAGGDAAKAAEALHKEQDYEVFTQLPFWEDGGSYTATTRRRVFLWEKGELRPITDELTEIEAVRLGKDGAAYMIGARYAAKLPVANQLWRLCLKSLALEEITAFGSFRHDAVLPLPEGGLLVCGCDMKKHGLNQNPGFYRLDSPAATPAVLDESGRYGLYNSVNSDLAQEAAPRMFAAEGWAYWVSTVDESAQLMAIDWKSGEIRQATACPGAVGEAAPVGGGIWISAMRGLHAGEIYRLGPDGGESQLTHFNDGPAESFRLAALQPFAAPGGSGGTVRGFVLKPPGLQPGQRCPAILDVHGGPKTVYGPVVFHEMQYWAAQGYAVIFCNPTGSDGRGDDFADIRGRYGQADYDDVMAFLDAVLAEHDWIDPQRLGITGGSYGGFMTNWAIGHTTRFKAAASQRCVSNWVTMHTISDIGYYFAADQAAATPWGDVEKMWEQSPLKYAHRAKTPTLFIHSDQDYRCPQSEGFQMYGALMEHGVECRLCLFHGESHGLSRSGKPLHRIRRLDEITRWMDRFLKAEPGK